MAKQAKNIILVLLLIISVFFCAYTPVLWSRLSGEMTQTTKDSIMGCFNNGYGIATLPNATISVDTSAIMYTSKANASITSINDSINSKVSKTAIITINGNAQNLSANRSWTISNGVNFYDSTGAISAPTKVWEYIVTPTTASGFSINIGTASFSSIKTIQITPLKNTSTATSCPSVSLKTVSTSAIVVNLTESNPSTVTILGIAVLSGAPQIFASSVSDYKLYCRIEGN